MDFPFFRPAAPSSAAVPASAPFWTLGLAEIQRRLGADGNGLSSAEAKGRLRRFGRNATGATSRRGLLDKIARRLIEPLIAILIVAALVAGATGDMASAAIIFLVIVASITLDVTQEHRAEAAVEALRHSVAIRTRALRDGKLLDVSVEDIAPGDVVALKAGDLVPADGLLLAADRLSVNEALLTGEPYPVEKRVAGPHGVGLAETATALFAGTAVVGGEARLFVAATGRATRLGAIAGALDAMEPPTAFERGVHALSVLILRFTVFLVLFVLLAHLAFARPPLESFLFAVALAVGLTPELLPMIVTVTLSRGAMRLAKRRVVVKRLSAIHDLGAMDVFCTDKTGTLTEARIALVAHIDANGVDNERVVELAALNARFETGSSSALDEALLDHTQTRDLGCWTRLDILPFDFDRRIASVLAETLGRRFLIVKGAPESVLQRATRIEHAAGDVADLDAENRRRVEALVEGRSRQGFRLLAVAVKPLPQSCDAIGHEDEADLTLVGFCVFLDPPKASAGAAIARLRAAGVRTKIVSGDAPAVVLHLVETLGLDCRGLLTGSQIAALEDHALATQAPGVDLYARVSPDQKTRVIRALQASGHVVGFMGDGINDAPALKAADVGLSVDGASEVARATADMILLDPDLRVVADGVNEGRRTYANIMKYIRMGTSSNFGNMLSMALASVAIPFLPLTPVQVLINNLIYDVSEIGIPLDAIDSEAIAAPHVWDMRDILRFTLFMGPLSSAFDIATFALLHYVYDVSAEVFRTSWFIESMATQILVIFLIRTPRPFWASRPHPALTATSLGALAFALALALGPFARWFGFAMPPAHVLWSIAGLVLAYLCLAEALKRRALGWTDGALASRVAPRSS